MLILYPITFLKVFMRSKKLLIEYSGTNRYGDLLSAHGIILLLTFYFYHFNLSCLLVVTKTSSAIRNRSRGGGWLCLVSDFEELC